MADIKSHVIVELNSYNRDKGQNEKPNWFLANQIVFNQSPSKTYYLRLENILIPKTFYDIDSTNNTFIVQETGGANTATIPEGNYTITELLTELESQLDANTNDGNTFTLSYDDITNKVTIQFVAGGTATIDTIANGSTLNDPLGFGKVAYKLNDDQAVLVDSTDFEAPYGVDLDTKSYVKIETKNITSANYFDPDGAFHIGTIVPINVDRNEKQYLDNFDGVMVKLNSKQPIKHIKMFLRDEYDNIIDLNGAAWSCQLVIYERTDPLKN